jgi:hypothetical protein
LRLNQIELFDELSGYRQLLNNPKIFEFVSCTLNPVWTAGAYFKVENITYDGGKTFITTTEQLFIGTYFFLDDIITVHTRTLLTLFDAASQVGGLYSVLFGFFGLIMAAINDKWFIDKAIKDLYKARENKKVA